jgi:hypothetical protein
MPHRVIRKAEFLDRLLTEVLEIGRDDGKFLQRVGAEPGCQIRLNRDRARLRDCFEVRFRTGKYGVPYFLAENEAKNGKEAVGTRAERGQGFKWGHRPAYARWG